MIFALIMRNLGQKEIQKHLFVFNNLPGGSPNKLLSYFLTLARDAGQEADLRRVSLAS